MRKRILFAIGGTLLVMLAIMTAASRSILAQSYAELERRYMERDIRRVASDIAQQTQSLAINVNDYAVWDETYAFARRPDSRFADDNFTEDVGQNLAVDAIIVADRAGALVYQRSFRKDPDGAGLDDALARWMEAHPGFDHFTAASDKTQGLIVLPDGRILQAAASPILDNLRSKPVAGTLVMARLLDDDAVRRLSAQLLLFLRLMPLEGPALPAQDAAAAGRITAAAPIYLDTRRGDTVSSYMQIDDVLGRPAVLVRVDSPRDITQRGASTMLYYFFWLLFIGVGFAAVVLLTVEYTVLSRLVYLGKSVLAIGTGGDARRRIEIRGRDQIAYIGAAINGMLDAQAQATEKLRASERRVEAFLDAVPDVIFRVTRDGTILDARSPARLPLLETANDLVGRDSEQILPLYSFISPELFDKAFAAVNVALDTGEPQSLVFHVDTDGGRRYYEDRFVASGENEVIVLVREVTDIEMAEEARRQDVLLKEIHHRVKNNLQVISSLLALQAGATKDADARALLAESRDRVRSMALIHEKLYLSEDKRGMSFASYVKDLVAHLRHSYTGNSEAIATVIDVEDVALDMDVSVPCGLLINELLSNALKYAFPDGRTGSITVRLRRTGPGTLALTVSDDGAGMPAGVNLEAPSTLGLRIVQQLVRQIRGTLEVGGGPGTAFTITFPEA
jgi:two-component sensor histidine kinase/sensor domain CHASE-containing protein